MRLLLILPGADADYPPGHLPAVVEARKGVMSNVLCVGNTLDVGTLPPGSPSVHKAGGNSGKLALMATPMVARAQQAEQDGYDAVVVYGTFDPGAEAARSFVKIPVVGTGRAGLLAALAVADRIGVLVYEPALVEVAKRTARNYCLEPFLAGVRAIEIPPTMMRSRAVQVRKRMAEHGRLLIEQHGAQVILPMGLSMLPSVVQADDLAQELGIPVIDPLVAAVRLAETLVLMKMSQSVLAYPN